MHIFGEVRKNKNSLMIILLEHLDIKNGQTWDRESQTEEGSSKYLFLVWGEIKESNLIIILLEHQDNKNNWTWVSKVQTKDNSTKYLSLVW